MKLKLELLRKDGSGVFSSKYSFSPNEISFVDRFKFFLDFSEFFSDKFMKDERVDKMVFTKDFWLILKIIQAVIKALILVLGDNEDVDEAAKNGL